MDGINRRKSDPDDDKGWYKILLAHFRQDGLELTMSDAARLRRILKECREQQDQIRNFANDGFEIPSEAIDRFYFEAFRIDLRDYLDGVKSADRDQRMQELSKHIDDKIRREMEML